MRYDVRYQVGGEEFSREVDAQDAAMAVSMVQDEHLDSTEVFELIQVHLLDELPDPVAAELEAANESS